MGETVKIRPAKESDVPGILKLIKELATYERAPEQVITSEASMLKDGFGPEPVYEALVAEDPTDGIIGTGVYFLAYSTWRGRILYLDDLVITEKHRQKGLGMRFFKELGKIALKNGADQLRWIVLDWNEPAIRFYQKINAELDGGWMNGTLRKEQIIKLAGDD